MSLKGDKGEEEWRGGEEKEGREEWRGGRRFSKNLLANFFILGYLLNIKQVVQP